MALTINTNLIDGIASPHDGFAIGQAIQWRIRVDNTSSYLNKSIFFNFATFIDSSLPLDFVNILPNTGYSAFLDTVGLKVEPTGASGVSSLTQEVPSISFELITANQLEIQILYTMTADTNQFIDSKTLDTLSRYIKNGYDNPTQGENLYGPTVYNGERAIRGHLVVGDTSTGTIDDQLHIDYLLEARYYEVGLNNGSPEYTDWSITLERSGDTVTTLSAFEDTTVKIQVDINAESITPNCRLLIYRSDSTTNEIDATQDTDTGYYSGGTNLYGIEYVSSYVAWALVAGTVYECSFVIDSAKISQGGLYNLVPVVINAGITLANSFQSDTIPATSLIPATTGTMTGELADYNDTYSGNVLVAAPYERIRSCVEVDKASYDAEVITNGTAGTFDSNLKSVEVVVTVLGIGEVLRLDNNTSDPSLEIIDNFDFYRSCLTIRLKPEWAGLAVFIDHVYTYEYKGVENTYEDIITFRQLINPDNLEEDKPTPDLITAIRFFDASNNPVTEICETFDGPLRVEVEKSATVPDYNLIALIKRDIAGEEPQEEESYTNNILEQLESDIITSVDATFGGDNLADFTIDENQLEKGQKYLVIAIAKEENATPPPACPVIHSEITAEVTAVSGVDFDTDIDVNFAITNFAPSTVSTVSITTTTDTGGSQVDNFVLDTGMYTYSYTAPGIPVKDVNFDVVVTLANGCVYTYSGMVTMQSNVGFTRTDIQDVEAD